ILHGELFPHNPQDKAESEMVNGTLLVAMTQGTGNLTEDSGFIKCLICKTIVKAMMSRLKRKSKEK
ncbi:Uncharacterized protein DAT39_006032, partial [Clarias magur]